MPKQTQEQLNQRRVTKAWNEYRKAREAIDTHINAHEDVFTEADELSERVNDKRKRLDKICRETAIGIGPITASPVESPVFDADYLEKLFEKKDPDILADLIVVKKTVARKVFESLVQAGAMTRKQASRAVIDHKRTVRITGIPDEIIMP